MKKGFTLIELIVVTLILAILVSIAIPVMRDYSKKSRTAELPYLIKTIVEFQMALQATPESGGEYATSIISLNWQTSGGDAEGKYYEFGTSGVDDCDPGTAADPLPVGLAEAWALQDDLVPDNWRSGCMDSAFTLYTNSL